MTRSGGENTAPDQVTTAAPMACLVQQGLKQPKGKKRLNKMVKKKKKSKVKSKPVTLTGSYGQSPTYEGLS